jgi:hypothetical protein
MTLVIRVTYSEFSESREVAFYGVQQARKQALYHYFHTKKLHHLWMRTEVVKYYIELLVIERSYIFQELK